MSEFRTIYKYPVPGDMDIEMPEGARVLCVQVQNGIPMLWALVDPNAEFVTRRFRLMVTGATFSDKGLSYIGTYQIDWFVGHVFEQVA
jgi:hypothetical protein